MRGDGPLVFFFVLLLIFVGAQIGECSHVDAQDAVVQPVGIDLPSVELPVTGEILALDAGERAPHDGMLVLDADLVAWRQAIERLSYRLAATIALDAQTLALRLDQERSRTSAAEDRLALHEGLWRDRATELGAALAASRAREGPALWENPIVWVIVGAVLGGAVVGLIAAATR